MKKIFITVLALFYIFQSLAQDNRLFAEFNYNTFSHSNLKSYLNELASSMQVPLSMNDDFGSNFGFTLGYEMIPEASVYFTYNTTGGKMSYVDYTGIVRLTQPLTQYTFGTMYIIPLLGKYKNFKLGINTYWSITTFKNKQYQKIFNNSEVIEKKYRSISCGLGPKIIYEYPVSFFKLRFSLGYDLEYNTKLIDSDKLDRHLKNNSGDAVKPNWGGLRTGIGISVLI